MDLKMALPRIAGIVRLDIDVFRNRFLPRINIRFQSYFADLIQLRVSREKSGTHELLLEHS